MLQASTITLFSRLDSGVLLGLELLVGDTEHNMLLQNIAYTKLISKLAPARMAKHLLSSE